MHRPAGSLEASISYATALCCGECCCCSFEWLSTAAFFKELHCVGCTVHASFAGREQLLLLLLLLLLLTAPQSW